MESQPQNPEFRINPGNFHPCIYVIHLYKLIKQQVKNDKMLSTYQKVLKSSLLELIANPYCRFNRAVL